MIKHFSDHAANERTYLAYLRTGLAFMGFGFVIERFDLFVRDRSSGHSVGGLVGIFGSGRLSPALHGGLHPRVVDIPLSALQEADLVRGNRRVRIITRRVDPGRRPRLHRRSPLPLCGTGIPRVVLGQALTG